MSVLPSLQAELSRDDTRDVLVTNVLGGEVTVKNWKLVYDYPEGHPDSDYIGAALEAGALAYLSISVEHIVSVVFLPASA